MTIIVTLATPTVAKVRGQTNLTARRRQGQITSGVHRGLSIEPYSDKESKLPDGAPRAEAYGS